MTTPRRPTPRTLRVLGSETITPNMLRITLGDAGPDRFPRDQESAYIKLMFPETDSSPALMRTYTVRFQRDDAFDVDFVLHEDGGPAAQWALNAKPGDEILIGGPGPKKLVDPSADWFLLAGDMTALPALSVNLEQMPADAVGDAVIEILHADDVQPLQHPPGVTLHWLVNPYPGEQPQLLADHLATLPWRDGRPSIWAACEFSGMRALRKFFREQRGVDRRALYISSYWKQGSTEDQHKVIKNDDARADEQA